MCHRDTLVTQFHGAQEDLFPMSVDSIAGHKKCFLENSDEDLLGNYSVLKGDCTGEKGWIYNQVM